MSRIKRLVKKASAMVLILSLLVYLIPVGFTSEVKAEAFEDQEVRFGLNTLIGNISHEGDNAFVNFMEGQNVPGFVQTRETYQRPDSDFSKGNVFIGMRAQPGEELNGGSTFEIHIADNPKLKQLAQSGQANISFGYKKLFYYEGLTWERHSTIEFIVDGKTKLNGDTYDDDDFGPGNSSASIGPNSVIEIIVKGGRRIFEDSEKGTGAEGVYIIFEDKERPIISDYTFKGTGNERENTTINQHELYVKKDETIKLAYHFSEPVKPTGINNGNKSAFFNHPLFTNDLGTGLPAEGQPQFMTNLTYEESNIETFTKDLVYQYKGIQYHNSGNLPLTPKITGEVDDSKPTMDQPLEAKMKKAEFADGAGNIANISLPGKAAADSQTNLPRNTMVNPFDYENGGYRVIVDAVAPKYTKGGNGIQPEILTGVTVNNHDTIDFTVQFSEEAVAKEGWDPKNIYLLLNNGKHAKYVIGAGTKNWTFTTDELDGGMDWETPLLKVIALTSSEKPGQTDTNVVEDYAGNMLIQPANFDGDHTDGNTTKINSKIDWAKLMIDNTRPEFQYFYEDGGASDILYKKTGKVTIDAFDPQIMVPMQDSIVADRGIYRPSRGIYRPSNMSSDSAPSVGLVYYAWTKSEINPLADKSSDNFAAVKRFSLTAKQPSEMYAGEFAGLTLKVANNKTNAIAPPAEALTDDGTGIWYLHTWTADMTWDSARELMQYEKMKTFVTNNASKYDEWLKESPSQDEVDRKIYADNKAMVSVGNYEQWELDDFKHDDSNWTYEKTEIHLDNRKPTIAMNTVNGNNTAIVTIPVTITDDHSGVQLNAAKTQSVMSYQWVKAGQQPSAPDWVSAEFTGNVANISSLNKVIEDGSYELYVQTADQAGNAQMKYSNAVTVNSNAQVPGTFVTSSSSGQYVKSQNVIFQVSGIGPQTVSSVTYATYSPTVVNSTYGPGVYYTISTNSVRPEGDVPYQLLTSYELTGTDTYSYLIPMDATRNGTQYVHIKIKADEGGYERFYYFTKDYYFDNLAPVVTFSNNGVGYPQPRQEVTITVTEPYSTAGLSKRYQWVDAQQPAPLADSSQWNDIPGNGKVSIDNSQLAVGDEKDYKLYVMAVDGAGNEIIKATTGIFKITKTGDSTAQPAAVNSDLVYLFGDEEDGYTAIIHVDIATVDKEGYEYSVSPDGTSWVNWKPYTNFVAVKLSSPDVSRIKFKVRTPFEVIGVPTNLQVSGDFSQEPVYALASLSTTRPVSPTKGVDIFVTPPVGIKVLASAANPSVPVRTGNTFHVTKSGYYSFDLTDLADPGRKATIYIVVSNVDDTAPIGSLEYSETGPTSGNVQVKLNTSEPVQITNNDGRSVYTFYENGTFTFDFKDEAGNTGSIMAATANIDREGPKVKIVHSYAYGENNSQTFGTIRDANNNVVRSSGVTLEIVKINPSDPDFTVPKGSIRTTLRENGTATFQAANPQTGTVTILEESVTTITSTPPAVSTVSYDFVDDDGNPVAAENKATINGVKTAKGNVKVTLSGRTTSDNKVFEGVYAVKNTQGDYTNQVSNAQGEFAISRIFKSEGSTVMALTDLLGNVNRVPMKIEGLDNKAPELTLKNPLAGIVLNKADFDFRKDLGGYTVTDNISASDQIQVSISGLNLAQLGRQKVTYTATDQVGNSATAEQQVMVVSSEGMLIFANDTLISASFGETALFDTNTLTFRITDYDKMKFGDEKRTNELATYDVYYQEGLYREGIMKNIASQVTYDQMARNLYQVTFPKTGWYTIIVRNQEREREYATFFIGGNKRWNV